MKTILITGAAQGIGLATARHYAAQGWFVGLYDLDEQRIAALLQAGGDFPAACGSYCDVTDPESVRAMFAHFSASSDGRLDLLVNNAGVLTAGDFENIDQRSHQQIIDVNVRGATDVLQYALPLLKQTPGATVVNLCSAASIHGLPKLAVYSASKFYIAGLTEALHLEWSQYGIRVTSVKPPLIDNAMGQVVAAELPQKLGMSLQSADVAELIQKAAEGRGTSFPLGLATRCWYWLDKLLPNRLRHALTGYLAGYSAAR